MTSLNEYCERSIEKNFESIFQKAVQLNDQQRVSQGIDLIFRHGSSSQSFADVQFLLATDDTGSSLLYSSQAQGNGLFSVVTGKNRVSFVRHA